MARVNLLMCSRRESCKKPTECPFLCLRCQLRRDANTAEMASASHKSGSMAESRQNILRTVERMYGLEPTALGDRCVKDPDVMWSAVGLMLCHVKAELGAELLSSD